ncbi:hypothetical protein [Parasulfitobacter algicola]|uniref:Uncharacterized protein n=1 Tax=Parasulfitobacter algicola TaxID=2614809 RepID=A0ABX2IQ63_9RHOB|nr:hypothetical protein [Sulfitobacter algicola]NSX53245.1 hypothetical protein [Sulfitobacter algicola]
MLDLTSSYKAMAPFGAFEVINMVDDWLPIDHSAAPDVFSDTEQELIYNFLKLVNLASEATLCDIHDEPTLKSSKEWRELSQFSVFAHGKFISIDLSKET